VVLAIVLFCKTKPPSPASSSTWFFTKAHLNQRRSLSDYLLAEIKEIAERPALAELRERLHKRKPVSAQIDTAHLVREEHEAMPTSPS
jgi:hypothetical protein